MGENLRHRDSYHAHCKGLLVICGMKAITLPMKARICYPLHPGPLFCKWHVLNCLLHGLFTCDLSIMHAAMAIELSPSSAHKPTDFHKFVDRANEFIR